VSVSSYFLEVVSVIRPWQNRKALLQAFIKRKETLLSPRSHPLTQTTPKYY
jgi:hypothetical protein